MVIPININWHEIAAPIFAGTVVSLLNKCVFNNPSLFAWNCCQEIEEEIMEDDTDSNNSGQTIASVDTINPHGVHCVHATTIPTFTH